MPLFCQIVDHKYVKCGLSYLNVLYILKDYAKSLLLIWKNYVIPAFLKLHLYTSFRWKNILLSNIFFQISLARKVKCKNG